jgi:hypothetical protein
MTDLQTYALAAASTVVAALWLAMIWQALKPRPPLPQGEDLSELF